MSEAPSQSPKQGWLRVGLVVLVVGLIAGTGLVWQRMGATLSYEPAIGAATFADGSQVEVVRCELTPKLEFRRPTWFHLFKAGSGRSWYHHMTHFSLNEENGRLVRASVERQDKKPCFMVLLRARKPGGESDSSDFFVMDEGTEAMQVKRKGTRASGMAAVAVVSGSVSSPCGLLVEVEDGKGGWLSVSGPVFLDTADPHALGLCPAFPRMSPKLRLRFRKPGLAAVEIEVPNPGYRPAAQVALRPEPLPAVRETNRYRVELQAMKLVKGGPPGRLVFWPDIKVKARGSWTTEHLSRNNSVEDAQGNSLSFSGSYGGYVLLPGERVVNLWHVLDPSAETYPWLPADGKIIAEGEWDDAGKMATARMTDEGRGLGFTDIHITPSKPSKSPTPPVIDVKIEGKGDEVLWRHVQSLSPHLNLVMFDASGNLTGRFATPSRSVGNIGTNYSWTAQSSWSGTGKPGSTFRLAIVPQPASEEHEFVVELPAASAP